MRRRLSQQQLKLLTLGFLFLLVVPNLFLSVSTEHGRGRDFRGFLAAGERFLAGSDIYAGSRTGVGNTWPPFFSVLFAPVSLIGRAGIPAAQCAWYCFNILLFFLVLQIWCRLFYDRSLAWFRSSDPLSLYDHRVLVPLVLIARPLLSNFVELQVNVLMLCFISMGLLAIKRGTEGKAGFWLGLAAASKAYPAVFAVWLIARRKWKALGGMIMWTGALTCLPFFRYGLDGPWATLVHWLRIATGGAYPLTCGNQSLYAALARWILFDWQTMTRVKLVSPPAGDLGCRLAFALSVLFFVSCLFVFARLAKGKRCRDIAVEGSIFCTIMVLFSPIAWTHYWTLTFPAWFCLVGLWSRTKDRWVLAVLCSAFGFVTVLPALRFIRSIVGCGLSAHTLGGALLLLGLLYMMGKGFERGKPTNCV